MEKWFLDLVSEVANLGKIANDEDRISTVINDIVNCICQKRNQNILVVRKGKDFNPNGIGFMCAYPKEIQYSPEKIKEIKQAIINGKTEGYNPNYNDITYSFYLINSIYHELWHCHQEAEIKEGIISKNSFFNALSILSQNYSNYFDIPYLERYHEGEAYGKGISDLFKIIEETLKINPLYSKVVSEQLKELNFFSKNINFANVINKLNQIPFISTQNGFENVIDFVSRGLVKMSKDEQKKAFESYPQLSVIYKEDGFIKEPSQLMDQYFNKNIIYRNLKSKITDQERNELPSIYLYALIPQLTPEIYEDLSKRYGKDNMDNFMIDIKNHIVEQKKTFTSISNTAKKDISFINDSKLLQGIDEKYVVNKNLAGLEYLYECENKINSLITKKENTKKGV